MVHRLCSAIYGLRNGHLIKQDNSSVRIITLLSAVKHLGSSQATKTHLMAQALDTGFVVPYMDYETMYLVPELIMMIPASTTLHIGV